MLKQMVAGLIVLGSVSFGQSKKNSTFNYPELLVAPRASERLLRESKKEEFRAWTTHWHVQLSALTTLGAALTMSGDKPEDGPDPEKEDEIDSAAQIGTLIGGGWLATTLGMSAIYRPYKSCYNEMKKMSKDSRRDKLARERAAEECLYAPATTGTIVSWLSFLTNAGAGGFMVATATEDFSKSLAGLAIAASFLPLIFDYRWEKVAEYHDDYKKRIYGPLAQIGVAPVFHERSRKMRPGLVATVRF